MFASVFRSRTLLTPPKLLERGRLFSSHLGPTHSLLQIHETSRPKPKLENSKLIFGKTFTDHMFEVDWNRDGWKTPIISPYHKLEIDPAASSLHYALQAFEGMKAYVDAEDRIRLFRPEMNMDRLQRSAARLCFPAFDEHDLLKCIMTLLKLEKGWIPKGKGYSLYIRPTMISTHNFIGVQPPESVKLFVILSPVGPYYPEGFSAVTLLAESHYTRAWTGGAGQYKLGANYGPTILPQQLAAAKGFTQILWLFGQEKYVTEVGTMNQFFFWKRRDGKKELITAALDGTILPGVTRDCILQLCADWGEFEVTQRRFTLKEVLEAIDEGRMIEAFGAGTAAIVSPVKGIHFEGKDYAVPLDPSDPAQQAGPLTRRLADTIMDIQYGVTSHPWSVLMD